MMDRFKPALYMVILFSLSIACCLSLDKGVVSALDNDRLAKVEDLLETVINKNQELEKRVEHLEAELLGQKIVNDELLKRLSELETEHETKQRVYENSDLSENDVYNGTQGGNKAVNDQTSQTYLWKEKEASPKVPKRNQHRHSKSKYSCVCFPNQEL